MMRAHSRFCVQLYSRDGAVAQVGKRLREPVRALPLIICGLDEASDNRGVAFGSALLEESYFITPVNDV